MLSFNNEGLLDFNNSLTYLFLNTDRSCLLSSKNILHDFEAFQPTVTVEGRIRDHPAGRLTFSQPINFADRSFACPVAVIIFDTDPLHFILLHFEYEKVINRNVDRSNFNVP